MKVELIIPNEFDINLKEPVIDEYDPLCDYCTGGNPCIIYGINSALCRRYNKTMGELSS